MRLRLAAHALLGLGAFAVAGHAGGPAAPEAWKSRLDAELAAIQADPAKAMTRWKFENGRSAPKKWYGTV